MTTLKGLPAFFQNSGTTVLDELSNFELGGQEEDEILGNEPLENNDDAFGDEAFGDLKTDNLPSFFTNPSHNDDDTLNILDSYAGLKVSEVPPPAIDNVYAQRQQPAQHPPIPPPGQRGLGGLPVPRPYSSAVSGAAPSAAVNNNNAFNSAQFTHHQPPAAPQHQQQQSPQQAAPPAGFTPRREYRRAKNMTQSDIRFIVGKVVQPLQSNDPFADDFYFLQLSIKKNAKMREAALRESKDLPPMIYVPLPTWKETKERIKLQIDLTRRGFQQKSREWEEKEQVLGHQVRTDVTKPREMLHVPTLAELDMDMMEDEAGDHEYKSPFTSRLWTIRAAVQRGFEALYTVQELHHLMSSPVIAGNPAATEEILREIDSAVTLLSHSIGIRTMTHHSGSAIGSTDFSLDGGHVGAILQTPKGKKLMSRSLKLLTPEHRWALLPVILARMFLSTTTAVATATATDASGAENQSVEHKLLRTIIEFLQYSFQHQIQQQNQSPIGTPAAFTNVLLTHLRACMKSVLVTQMEKSKLRQALVTDRVRAEVMHMIVQIGDKVSTVSDARLREDWIQTREAFMSTLDS